MHFTTTFLGAGLVSTALAAYTIQDDYSGNNFFSMFTFDTEDDPTHGYVNYVDSTTAQTDNLTSVDNGVVTIRSDSTSVASGRGRNSVRITSTKQYTHGLVVLDLQHMPGSACGVWPAFWMTGPDWPNNGEIDIIEGVNNQNQDAMTMHTSSGCTMVNADCQGNTGCGTQAGGSTSFGDGFNNANGGVYAMEWTSSAINIWFFSRGSIPSDATGANPDPSTWGTATASFQGGDSCTIDDHFNNNNIVFDTTFCGDWAGSVWGSDSTCSSKAASCTDYVQNNPQAFESAYWTINSLKVYSNNGGSASAVSTVASASSTALASTVAQPSSTPSNSTSSIVIASATPTPSPSSVSVGTSTPGGPITEDPNTEEKLTETADGKVEWSGPGKRDVLWTSMHEAPALTKRVVGDGEVEVGLTRGRAARHLRRHLAAAGGSGHRHSH